MAKNPKRIRNVKFTTGRVIQRTQDATAKAFSEVAIEMTNVIQKSLSVPVGRMIRVKMGKNKRMYKRMMKIRSAPGQPPRKDTGFLHDTTEVVARGRELVVRTPQYGIYLDGGTSRMMARPFIRKTIHDQRRTWERRLNALMRKYSK